MQIATRTLSQGRRQVKEAAMKALEETSQKLWLYMRGADMLIGDDATYLAIRKGLVKSTGIDKAYVHVYAGCWITCWIIIQIFAWLDHIDSNFGVKVEKRLIGFFV